ncbi:hypothetical protein V8C42DRAFT_330416 [Trichoderma barbatum]
MNSHTSSTRGQMSSWMVHLRTPLRVVRLGDSLHVAPSLNESELLFEENKEEARRLMKAPEWDKNKRICCGSWGGFTVVESNPKNPYLRLSEYKFLLKMLRASFKHSLWAETADRIETSYSLGAMPLVQEVLGILTKCLEIVRQDESKIESLLSEQVWSQLNQPLFTWLPHTICRILGHKMADGDSNALNVLKDISEDLLQKVCRLMALQLLNLAHKQNDPSSATHEARELVDSMSMFWRQKSDIESEIEHMRGRVENGITSIKRRKIEE